MNSMSMKSIRTASALIAVALVYLVAGAMSAALLAGLGVEPPRMPDVSSPFISAVLAATVSVLGLWPLARLLPGHWVARGVLLSIFCVTAPLNNAWEASRFTTFGGTQFLLAYPLLPSAALGLLMALLVPGRGEPVHWGEVFKAHSFAGWALRIAIAWLSFPIIYWAFGSMISGFVMDMYTSGLLGLRLPAPLEIIATAFGRSITFLLSVLPLLLCVRAPRRRLALALGWAYWALVGLAGLLSTDSLPLRFRVVHGAEIGADSFAYAFVLVWLLGSTLSQSKSDSKGGPAITSRTETAASGAE